MVVVAQVKLIPTPEQATLLRDTLVRVNAACDWMSAVAWERQTFRRFDLHKLVYYEVRKQFGLAAQSTARAIAKVADAYNLDRQRRRTFRATGSIAYDDRLLLLKPEAGTVSLWTLSGRVVLPYVCGERQRDLLRFRKGEADLCFRDGNFYLLLCCKVPEPEVAVPSGVLGVDLGVVNIATDSDGRMYSGKTVNNVRARHRKFRTRLQQKGTKSARRRLKQSSGKERRFATHVNHCVSKQIVNLAERTGRAIAVEELTGIRERIRARRQQRAILHSWSFAQLRAFLKYKARLRGVALVSVDPANTSRTCPACGCIDRANRVSQSKFRCQHCGHAALADVVGAVNIASRGCGVLGAAVVSQPNVSATQVLLSAQGQSRRL